MNCKNNSTLTLPNNTALAHGLKSSSGTNELLIPGKMEEYVFRSVRKSAKSDY